MLNNRKSFFQRLTGSDDFEEEYDFEDFAEEEAIASPGVAPARAAAAPRPQAAHAEEHENEPVEEDVGQLTVDVYQTPEEIVIKAIVAGVRPDHLDVQITRDMVTVNGKREEAREVESEDYFYQELYWGGFSRTILLPQEIDVEEASAVEKHGVLTLRLPKIDKEKQTKLKVKSG